MRSLKTKIFRNLGAISFITYFSKINTIITGIFLARLLSPSDFGIYGLAASIMAMVLIFDDMGIKTAVIQKKTNDESLFYTGFFIEFLISLVFFIIISTVLAPWCAMFYKTPDVKNVLIFLSLVMLINNFKFISETRIIKYNNLDRLILPKIIESISYSISAILLAFLNFRYWSFVYAKVISTILCIISFWKVSPWPIRFTFDKHIGKSLINFGKYILLAGFFSILVKQIDNLMVGKILGLSILGYYTIAYRWGNMFPTDIGTIINQVLYPINVQYQDNIPMIEKMQVKSMKYASLVVFPITLGFFIICPEFIFVVLGEKWAPAIVPLQIFSIHGLFWALEKRGNIFEALGKPKYIALIRLLRVILMVILIIPFTKKLGIIGTSIAVLLSAIVIEFVFFWSILYKLYNLNLKKIFGEMVVPFLSSLIMLAVIYFFKRGLYDLGVNKAIILFFSVLIGALTYSLLIFIFVNKEMIKIFRVLKYPNISIKEKMKILVLNS